jgi:sarcosine oxidase subunit beta
MRRYSFLSLARHAFTGHREWTPAWRSPPPKPRYEVLVIGGGLRQAGVHSR